VELLRLRTASATFKKEASMPRAKNKTVTKIAGVAVTTNKLRKKNPPRTAFKKGGLNPFAFQPGQSGNPGGKVKPTDHLLSKSLRVALADRASDDVCKALGLPIHSSWSQCLARKLVYMAIRGDLAAIAEIRALTEISKVHATIDTTDGGLPPPLFEVVFVDAVDGRPAPGQVIDARPAAVLPALPGATD
jgi:Family of unknown function (DUF5681)